MSCFDEPFNQILEGPTCLCCMTMVFVEGAFLAAVSYRWVRFEGSRPPEVGQPLDHWEKFFV